MILDSSFPYKGKRLSYDELKPSSKIPITVQCDECGEVFHTTKQRITRNGHQLCQACALRLKREKTLPVGSQYGRLTVIKPGKKAGFSLCNCSCDRGIIKEYDNYLLLKGTTKSCGCLRSECGKRMAMEYLSQYQHGEAHPGWKGGISSLRNRIEKTNDYKSLKNAVFDRENFACQKCGSTENIQLHHICNFVDYPELRLDEENCACLCSRCHKAFHSTYGLKNTTREQFFEFLG